MANIKYSEDTCSDIISNLEKEKAELLAEIMNLKQELRNSKLTIEVARNSEVAEVTNVDIMRRLSQLEKLVYNSFSKATYSEL